MKIIFLGLIVAVLLIAGCTSNPTPKNENVTNESMMGEKNVTANGTVPTVKGGEGTIIEAPSGTTPTEPNGNTPSTGTTQQDCSTLAASCDQCVAKAGCGWCKTSNGCYKGDANGPSGDVNCQPADWAATEEKCKAPTTTAGTKCSEQPNCAFCLSGTGCKWCIQGAKCVDANSNEECFGGYMTKSFQCNFASR